MNPIVITVSEDKMEARLTIAEVSPFPTYQEIEEAIKTAGITEGIDREVLKNIAHDKQAVNEKLIARGIPPKKGDDAQLVWYVKQGPPPPSTDEKGFANYKWSQSFEYVEKGTELVSKLPPTEGSSGVNVFGQLVWEKGHDIPLPKGENTAITPDGLSLYSLINGYALVQDGKVTVDNTCKITGDVDYNTGNLKFDGNVHITGDVRSGFSVYATDTIIVEGSVEAANVYSQQGDIIVKCGIIGKHKAKIIAGGSLYSGFIQDANVSVKRRVIVDHYIINSQIASGGVVNVKNNEGLIRGGKVISDRYIEAKEVGAPRNIATEIGINEGSDQGATKHIFELQQELTTYQEKLAILEKHISFLLLLKERLGTLSEQKQLSLDQYQAEKLVIEKQIKKLLKLKEKAGNAPSQDTENVIRVYNVLHKGVTINFGFLQCNAEKRYSKVEVIRQGSEIVFRNIKPKDR